MSWTRPKKSKVEMTFTELHATLSPDEQVELDERAAIIEYQGGQPKATAERWAVRDWELKKEKEAKNGRISGQHSNL